MIETTRDNFRYGEHPHVALGTKRDRLFVECVGGDLTVKIEDNTQDGKGIYNDPEEVDPTQGLGDADIYYAELGKHLILMKIKPYREESYRYLVYSALSHRVERIDGIGVACVQLPEDQGIIFPGGCFLNNGEMKLFDHKINGLEFKRVIRSPNQEDVLYVFHRRDEGLYVLLQYNLIRKEIANTISCHGYSIFDDGHMVVFHALKDPTRIHQMKTWQTPFVSDEFADAQPNDGSFLARVGNGDLVCGISDCLGIQRSIADQKPTMQIYEDLISQATRIIDTYPWLAHTEAGELQGLLKEIRSTAELIIDEFEKVMAMRQQATSALTEAEETQSRLIARQRPEYWQSVDDFVEALNALRNQRGHLITMRSLRYMDTDRVDELEAQVIAANDQISAAAVDFLLKDEALEPYHKEVQELTKTIDQIQTVVEAEPVRQRLESMSQGLDLLTEIVGSLKIDDANARTRILESMTEVFGQLNRTRGLMEARRKELLSKESVAEFAAQFKLFGQSVTSAMGLADTPEKCDDQLSRLLVQLEDLESRFSEFDEFLLDLATKREEVFEAFETRKQSLLEERQRRAANMAAAAGRILQGIARRAQAFKEDDALNAYFASDAMVIKVRDTADSLRALGDSVKADDIEARLKASRDQALRALRDKQDIFDDGGKAIRLGRHRFSVNTQNLELTMLPREEGMSLHLTGTEFYETIDDEALNSTQQYWSQTLISERDNVYRGEYLAFCMLEAAERNEENLTLDLLHEATRAEKGLTKLVADYAAERYDEGYDRGVHDADAAAILEKLLHLRDVGGLLRFAPGPRSLACLFWAHGTEKSSRDLWHRRARSLGRLRASLGHVGGMMALAQELAESVEAFLQYSDLPGDPAESKEAGAYLAEELTADHPRFVTSAEATELRQMLMDLLDGSGTRGEFESDLRALGKDLKARQELLSAWFEGLLAHAPDGRAEVLRVAAPEAVVLMLTERGLDREPTAAATSAEVGGLIGQHARIKSRTLHLRLDEFLPRLRHFCQVHVPGYKEYRALRSSFLEGERHRLRLEEYMPKVLTSFVRNKLITDVYLPIIGDNLAKQMGALGAGKRTDLMGLLLLISPPGYGKTTLMEYVANSLGLIFMKINGPALGHSVHSLDPSEAPNATARQELLKLNLALEMGNNVMLYLDDIQHTHPEFLQKFISLCDAQRRIEGVWKNRTRTYDLRGKKFCVIMAGNPYTESGEKFQIPDMLANRADTYNLGDILNGREEVFALSYIENTMTSNPVLAPLATRDPQDTYKLIRIAKGENIPPQELKHTYSSVEINELITVFKKLFVVQDLLLQVNQAYITSASQDDAYRTEPPFKLQGSYRNMNKIAEKIAAVMNEAELQALLDDHYIGEAQTLTTGAEQNLLKLAELRGRLKGEDLKRWEGIKKEFQRLKMMGGGDDDPVNRVTGQLSSLVQGVDELRGALSQDALRTELAALRQSMSMNEVGPAIEALAKHMANQSVRPQLEGIQTSIAQAAHLMREQAAVSKATNTQKIDTNSAAAQTAAVVDAIGRLNASVQSLSQARMNVQIVNKPSTDLEQALAQQIEIVEWSLVPLVRSMAQDLQGGREIWQKLNEVMERLKGLRPDQTSTSTTTAAVFESTGPATNPGMGTDGWPDPGPLPQAKPRGPSSGVVRPQKPRVGRTNKPKDPK